MGRIYNLCGREVQITVDEMMTQRIERGLSRLYPERSHFSIYDITHRYILVNYACAIILVETREVFDMELKDFKKFMTSDHIETIDQHCYYAKTSSYDECIIDGTDDTFLKLIPDNHAKRPASEAIKSYSKDRLLAYIDGLPSYQRKIIQGIFFQYKTEVKMASELGISQSYVHYHKEKALKSLYQLCIEDGIAPGDYE